MTPSPSSPALAVDVGRVLKNDGSECVSLSVSLGKSAAFVLQLQPEHACAIAQLMAQEAANAMGKVIVQPGGN